jgi:hypothetical protein
MMRLEWLVGGYPLQVRPATATHRWPRIDSFIRNNLMPEPIENISVALGTTKMTNF